MRTWFTSDQHFGHIRVSELRGFASVEEHDEALIQAHNEVVQPDDLVWFLGDLTISESKYKMALQKVSRMNGRKRLVPGNHDAAWAYNRHVHKFLPAYHEVFEMVQPFARIRLDGTRCMLSHFPYEGDHTSEDRFVEARLRDYGVPLLNGHVHGAWTFSATSLGTPQINVGLDVWDLLPVSSENLLPLITSVAA